MGKGEQNEPKFKCDYCKAAFETFEDGEAHHQKSRHKKKEMKILAIHFEPKVKSFDDYDIGDEESDFEPDFEELEKPKKKKAKLTPRKTGRRPSVILPRARNNDKNENNNLQISQPVEIQPDPKPAIKPYLIQDIPREFILPPKMKGELFYKCILCENWYDTFDALKSHQLELHESEDIKPYISQTSGGTEMRLDSLTIYFCPKCNFQTYTQEEIKLHRLDHDDANNAIIWYLKLDPGKPEPEFVEEATYYCSQCHIMPDILPRMTSHWDTCHSHLPLKISRIYFKMPPKKHECDLCSKTLSFLNHLTLHQKYFHKK